jgi:acyl dehydratase
MPIDRAHLGRRYGPFRYDVARQAILDFVAAVGGGVPGRVFPAPPDRAHPHTVDADLARAAGLPDLVAPPTFATVFAIQPFAAACADPALALNVLRLVHSEQDFEFHAPVHPGDVLETSGEITRVQVRGSLDFLEVTTESKNQRGELVVRGVWTAIVRN